MTGPRFTPLVAGLPATVPFVGPETQERAQGFVFTARIGANENVFGPSPKAIAAMAEAACDIWQYCDPENHDLKQALAAHHGVKPENIVIGEGIDGLQNVLVRMLVDKGTAVVTSAGAYPTFNFHVAGAGGDLHMVPFRDDREDPDSLLAKAAETGAALIYFSNPDNPMGTWHNAEKVQSMIDALPADTVLCLDEAYIEFAGGGDEFGNALAPPLDVTKPNVIRFRTFSKAYGMAGARIGYGIAHADLALAFNKIRNHFGVNRIAQAGALAALADHNHLRDVVAQTKSACARIAEIARLHNLMPLPSAANFVAIDCGRDADYAKTILEALVARGVFIRMPFVAPQNRCIRVTAGKPEHLAAFEEALAEVLRELS